MRRSGSQSSSNSSYSATCTERNEFPSYEDLFFRPPVTEASRFGHTILNGLVSEDENEAPIRALLDEMRDWYEEQSEETGNRFFKPLPPPPVEESDEEDAIRKPFGAARALRKVMASNDSFLSISATPPLNTKASAPSTPLTSSPGPKTPTSISVPRRPFADVPQSPISVAFADSPCPSPTLQQSSMRARSSSLPLCKPGLKAVRSEVNLRRPPPLPLKQSSTSLGTEHVFLHPGFNKSFSAPSTPTATEFMQAKANRPPMLKPQASPYSNPTRLLVPEDIHLRPATHSRWSLSTAAQDDVPPPSPFATFLPEASRRGLPRSPSRLGLGLSFAKFELSKLVRFPSRSGNRKRLIIKGVKSSDGDAFQNVKIWCQEFGAIDRISQKASGEIHVHFRNRNVADRVCRAYPDVTIGGAGKVSLSYSTSSKQK